MIDAQEDQAAGLRRLFRRSPPTVAVVYVAGRSRSTIALRLAYALAAQTEGVLLLDEAPAEHALATPLGLSVGADLLSMLGDKPGDAERLLQPVPGLVGRVPVAAAALSLPLIDRERRLRLVDALRALHLKAGFVLVHSCCEAAADPSPFVFAAPRRLVVAEASRSGAKQAYQVIKKLAAAGAGLLHVAVAGARNRQEANDFFGRLEKLVLRHVGVPLAWLGEVERDNMAAGLTAELEFEPPTAREPEAAFLKRLAMLARAGDFMPARQMDSD